MTIFKMDITALAYDSKSSYFFFLHWTYISRFINIITKPALDLLNLHSYSKIETEVVL